MLDIKNIKNHLREEMGPYFKSREEHDEFYKDRPWFTVLDDMSTPTDINAGRAFVAQRRDIESDMTDLDFALSIIREYDYFAFYKFDVSKDGKEQIRFGAFKYDSTLHRKST